MTTQEMIARLDAMERLLAAYQTKLSLLKHDLRQTLDKVEQDMLG